MIKAIKNWYRSRKLGKAIADSGLGLSNVLLATSIEREAREQYSLGACTCSVMKDKNELKARIKRRTDSGRSFAQVIRSSAEKAWLEG